MKYKLLLAIIITCLGFQLQASSQEDLEGEFKGNWEGQFCLNDGTPLVHTPQNIELGHMFYDDIDMDGGYLNGMPLSPTGLHLLTNSTEEEFEEALRASGLYG